MRTSPLVRMCEPQWTYIHNRLHNVTQTIPIVCIVHWNMRLCIYVEYTMYKFAAGFHRIGEAVLIETSPSLYIYMVCEFDFVRTIYIYLCCALTNFVVNTYNIMLLYMFIESKVGEEKVCGKLSQTYPGWCDGGDCDLRCRTIEGAVSGSCHWHMLTICSPN